MCKQGFLKNMTFLLYTIITTEKRTIGQKDGRTHVCGWKNKQRSKWEDPWRKMENAGRDL